MAQPARSTCGSILARIATASLGSAAIASTSSHSRCRAAIPGSGRTDSTRTPGTVSAAVISTSG